MSQRTYQRSSVSGNSSRRTAVKGTASRRGSSARRNYSNQRGFISLKPYKKLQAKLFKKKNRKRNRNLMIAGIWGVIGLSIMGYKNFAFSCTVSVSPGENIQNVINAQPEGAAICFNAGTYSISTTLTPKRSQKFVGNPARSAIWTGNNGSHMALNGQGVTGVEVSGLIIEKFLVTRQGGYGTIKGGNNWVIHNNEFRWSNSEIYIESYGKVTNNYFHHSWAVGGGAYKGTDFLFENNEVAFMNPNGYNDSVTKWTATRNLIVRGNYVHDNRGNGIWVDGDNINFLIENNRSESNLNDGIHYEISCAGTVRNNIVMNNGRHGISVVASQDAQIYENYVKNNQRGGLVTWHQSRGAGTNCEWTLKNVRFFNNIVQQDPSNYPAENVTGVRVYNVTDGNTIYDPNDGRVKYYGNTYYNNISKPFYWSSALRTTSEWKSFGQDIDGKFLTGQAPPPSTGGTTDSTPPTVNITTPSNGFVATGSIGLTASANDNVGVTKVEFYINDNLLNSDSNSPFTITWDTTSVANGSYTLTARAYDAANNATTSSPVTIQVVNQAASGPFGGTAWTIPGKIEAENYDLGGQGSAYNDGTPGNLGGAYRNNDVDIKPSAEGGYTIGWLTSGEWMKYTVNVAQAGDYTLTARVGSAYAGRSFYVEFGGVNKSGTVEIPQTAAWDQYQSVSVPVSLSAGIQTMRIVMAGEYADLNWVNLTAGVTTNPTPSDTAAPTAPTNLRTTNVTRKQVNLSWNVSTDNVGVTGYYVYRSDKSSPIAFVSTTSYSDRSVKPNGTYTYSVAAVDAVKNQSARSNSITVTAR